MTIVDDAYVMEHFRKTRCFLNRHAREMGARGKPRTYDLELVEEFFRRYHRERIQLPRKRARTIPVPAAAAAGSSAVVVDIGEFQGRGKQGKALTEA